MENLNLLSQLVEQLQKEKIILERELASLYKKQTEVGAEQEKIAYQIRTKESEAITQDKIEKYKEFWQSLSANDAPPCPLCFIFYDIKSDLIALPERHHREHFRCRESRHEFHVPLP